MNKCGLIKGKAKQATQLILTCIIAAVCIWFVYGICNRFLRSPSSIAGSEICVQCDAPARFYSTVEKQRIMRDEGFYKGKIDGRRGTLTIDAEREHAKLYNNWCAKQEPNP